MSETSTIRITRRWPDADATSPAALMTPKAAGMISAPPSVRTGSGDRRDRLEFPRFFIAVPKGSKLRTDHRSAGRQHGIGSDHSPGTIDADYRGEVMIAVINQRKQKIRLSGGDRIAQMVISRVFKADLKVVAALDETDRNAGGFGHTGIK
jgi:dUTP pyrophosphatase